MTHPHPCPIRPIRQWNAAALALLAVLTTACSDSNRADAADSFGTTRSDAGGASGDGGAPFEDVDYDNEIRSDEGQFLCGYQDSDLFEFETHVEHTAKGSASSASGMVLSYHGAMADLFITGLPSGGEPSQPARIVSGDDAPRGPMAAAVDEQFMLLWRGLSDGAHRLYARSLDNPNSEVVTIADDLVVMAGGATPADVAGQQDDFVVALLQQSGGLRAARFDPTLDTPPQTVEVPGIADRSPMDIHLARLDDNHTLLTWLEQDAGRGRVMGVILDPALATTGDVMELSDSEVDGGSFDLAGRSGSAGLLYHTLESDRDALKFRRIETDGTTPGPVLNLVAAPGRGIDGAIEAFGQGYVIAHRALPSPGITTPVVRIAFINQSGLIVHEAQLADTTGTGGQLSVSATPDGHVVVSWTSITPSTTATGRAARLYCPGALLLCGGHVE